MISEISGKYFDVFPQIAQIFAEGYQTNLETAFLIASGCL